MCTLFCFVRFAFPGLYSSNPCDFFLCYPSKFCCRIWTISVSFFFVISDVHNIVTIVYKKKKIYFPFGYNTSGSFVLVDCCQIIFYGLFAIITRGLNQIIRLTGLIRSNRVNDSNIRFFLFLYKNYHRLSIFFMC